MPVYSTRPNVMGMATAAPPSMEKTIASTVMTTSSHLAKCVEMAEQIEVALFGQVPATNKADHPPMPNCVVNTIDDTLDRVRGLASLLESIASRIGS